MLGDYLSCDDCLITSDVLNDDEIVQLVQNDTNNGSDNEEDDPNEDDEQYNRTTREAIDMCNKLKLFIANDNEYSQQFYDNINKLHDYCTDKIILRQKSIVGYLN